MSENDAVWAKYRPYGHPFATARADVHGRFGAIWSATLTDSSRPNADFSRVCSRPIAALACSANSHSVARRTHPSVTPALRYGQRHNCQAASRIAPHHPSQQWIVEHSATVNGSDRVTDHPENPRSNRDRVRAGTFTRDGDDLRHIRNQAQ